MSKNNWSENNWHFHSSNFSDFFRSISHRNDISSNHDQYQTLTSVLRNAIMRIKSTLLSPLFILIISSLSINIANSQCDSSNFTINTFINSDSTIRPFGNSVENGYCAYKRWNDYVLDHNVWLWPCDSSHVKYQWSYDSGTKQIFSIGSQIKYPDTPFCWYVKRPEATWAQQVRIKECDVADDSQKFVMVDGRIYRAWKRNEMIRQ